jgi:hypothetical protein
MVAEPTQDTYPDFMLSEMLQRYPLPDSESVAPTDTAWLGAWDANMAAADVWDEKAAAWAGNFDFAADGGDYKRSQVYHQMVDSALRFRRRRKTTVLILTSQPPPDFAVWPDSWIGNAPEREL